MKKILFAASEAVPFIKTGGLADVVGSLPKCFDKKEYDVRVIIPKYKCIKEALESQMVYKTHFYMDIAWNNQYVGVFEMEYDPEEHLISDNLPFTVEKSEEEEDTYIVEGPRIEKMLGYTNLESEKGFAFFQNFLKDNGILEMLEELGIQEGDTVRMYGLQFDYYK